MAREGGDSAQEAAAFAAALQNLMEVAEMDSEVRSGGAQGPTLVFEDGQMIGRGAGFGGWHVGVDLIDSPSRRGRHGDNVLLGSPMQEESSSKFVFRLKRAMADRGLKASHLAAEAEIAKGYLSEVLSGRKGVPSFETCKKIADVLKISPEWLMFGTRTVPASDTAAGIETAVVREEPAKYSVRQPGEPTMVERLEMLQKKYDATAEELAEINRKLDAIMDLFGKGRE